MKTKNSCKTPLCPRLLTATVLFFVSCHTASAQITPENDTLFLRQRALFEQMNVFEAWETTRGSAEVVIGCIDNGFDFYHPYLHGRVMPGYWVAEAFHPESVTTAAHGTLVSGLMVANPLNENGVHGLAPGCKILTASMGTIEHYNVKRMAELQREIKRDRPDISDGELFMESQKVLSTDSAALQFGARWGEYVHRGISESIVYLVDRGLKLINISGAAFDPSLNEAFEYAHRHDVLLVVAAGNNSREITELWPNISWNRENVIVVGATDQNDERWTVEMGGLVQGSNWGELLDVCAPGTDLAVCMPSDPRFYQVKDGPTGALKIPYEGMCDVMPNGATSSATPMVTALAALIYSVAPELTAAEVKQAILAGADDIGEPGVDPYTGHGRINYGRTLALVMNRRTE